MHAPQSQMIDILRAQVLDQINKKVAMFRENYMILPRFLDEASLKIEALVKQSFIVSVLCRECVYIQFVRLFSYAVMCVVLWFVFSIVEFLFCSLS